MQTRATTLTRLERRLHEACDELWDSFVDPQDALSDGGGELWRQIGAGIDGRAACVAPFTNEQQLAAIRAECRALAVNNEFAINGHENRISYVVGSGHTYRAAPLKALPPSGRLTPVSGAQLLPHPLLPEDAAALAARVQSVLDQFIETNAWHRRQQEIVRRRDRDGEVFLRFFADARGATRVRFVEPGQVATPPDRLGDPAAALGIQTERDDVESVLAYFIDGRPVDARDVQHRKANVDANVRRGLPLFYPVRTNLRRAEKLLRNMSAVAEIQSAIALIRRHRAGTRSGVQQFVADQVDASLTSAGSGRVSNFKRYAPGTILDAPAGIEYDFPAAGLNAGTLVAVLQAELRAIASRLVMPEFMLSSDASNANYSSTLVAEGPAVKMFQRLQQEMIEDDRQVMWRVVENAVTAGRLAPEALTTIEIQIEPPSVAVRDTMREVQAFAIEHKSGILSPQTWSQRRGLDYDQEQANLSAHREKVQTRGEEITNKPNGLEF